LWLKNSAALEQHTGSIVVAKAALVSYPLVEQIEVQHIVVETRNFPVAYT